MFESAGLRSFALKATDADGPIEVEEVNDGGSLLCSKGPFLAGAKFSSDPAVLEKLQKESDAFGGDSGQKPLTLAGAKGSFFFQRTGVEADIYLSASFAGTLQDRNISFGLLAAHGPGLGQTRQADVEALASEMCERLARLPAPPS